MQDTDDTYQRMFGHWAQVHRELEPAPPGPSPQGAATPAQPAGKHGETAVLGAVLVDNDNYWRCVELGLKPQHFFHALHARLWQAMAASIEAGQQATPFTIQARLGHDAEFEAEGGMIALGKAAMAAGGIRDIADYARLVIEWSNRRALVALGQRAAAEALDGRCDYAALVGALDAGLSERRPEPARGGIRPVAEAMRAAQESNRRAREAGALDGVPYGLARLDAVLGGVARSDLAIVAGRPGMGKSALAAHVALHNARAGRHVVVFTLEMSQEQIANRWSGQLAGIPPAAMRRGDIGPGQLAALDAASDALAALPLHIDQTAALDAGEMRARLRRHCARHPLDLVIVDYLQLMKSPGAGDNRVAEVSAITAALKGLAKELNVPVIALSQLSRAVEGRDDKRPRLSDLRESGSIEQDADAVIFVFRRDYYQAEPSAGGAIDHARWRDAARRYYGTAELIVAKNRHGPCQSVPVGFDPALTRFHDLEASGADR